MSYFNNQKNNCGSFQKNTSNIPAQGYHMPCNNNNKRYQPMPSAMQKIQDYGPYPFAANIEELTKSNNTFRTALWTGPYLQVTLMSIPPGEDIGLEMHENLDQFVRIEDGKGILVMGDNPNTPSFQQTVMDDFAFVIPAGKWHNLINIGTKPIKLYSIYSPPQHPFGTVHETKADAEAAEHNY